MSIYYDVAERLIVDAEKQTELQKWIIAKTYERFCNLADGIQATREKLYDYYAGYSKIKVVVDGTVWEFANSDVGDDYRHMLSMLKNATQMDLTAIYSVVGWCWNLPEDNTIDGCYILPEDMMFILREKMTNNPDAMEGIFFSYWSAVDCGESQGNLEAYGTYKGVHYAGNVPSHPIDKIPEGTWSTDANVLMYYSDYEPTDPAYRDAHISEIIAICHKLAAISKCDYLYEDGEGVEMCLDIHDVNTQELLQFSELAVELWRLSKGDAAVEIRVNEFSGDFPRILEMELNTDGTYSMRLAEI